jgi:hypothetical protein
MNAIVRYLRGENDPEIVEGGPSSLTSAEKLAKGLGWLSIALGVTQLVAGRRLAEALGLDGKAGLVRLTGAREIGSGMMTLSPDKRAGLWSRVGGDVMDILLVATALDAPRSHQRSNAKLALAAVAGVTVLDLIAARAITLQQARREEPRNFGHRSGFPRGLNTARGAAKSFRAPADMRDSMRARG